MTITERIFLILSQKKITQKDFSKQINVNEKTVSAWKKNNSLPPLDKISDISDCLGVSIDYLLTGKEKNSPKLELKPDEQELLDNFNKLSERSKGRLLEKAENLVELETKEKAEKENKPHIETVFMAARSSDNHPPEIVTGDFSDILNAPDVTKEY